MKRHVRGHFVYRAYDADGRLIYIGATSELMNRWDQHEALSWWYEMAAWVEAEPYPTRDAAFAAEMVAIQEEQPAFNIRHTTDGPVLTEADAQVAWNWRSQPFHSFTSMALIDRVNEFRFAGLLTT